MFASIAKMLRWCPRWGVSAAVVALILWLTLAPHPVGDTELPLFPGADKLVHAIMFGALTLCLWFDSGRRSGSWNPPSMRTTLCFALASALFGLLIEWLQLRMQMGRGFEWADAAADLAGCLLVWIITGLVRR